MNSLKYVGKDEPLTTEQGLYLMPSVVAIARRTFVGRKLLSPEYIDPLAETYAYDKLTEMSAARIDPKYPGKEVLDIIDLTRTPVNIPCTHHEFVIPKADLDASQMSGIPLTTKYSDAAAYQVGLKEDSMIINGTDVIPGLYNGAGNTETGADWTTATNIPITLKAAIVKLVADHIYGPYNLAINPTQDIELDEFVASTAVPWRDRVLARIGGQIFSTEAITNGTGILMKAPIGNDITRFSHVISRDINVETEVESIRAGAGLFGRVFVNGLPVIKDSNAICQLTTI
jgi:uncharacterized linocin/CFP29 family protein